MKKLKLKLDDLRVESFDTTSIAGVTGGTVVGQAGSGKGETGECFTCGFTCDYTCGQDTECSTCGGDASDDGLCGGSAGCATNYWTCYCADQSVEGYASCGTTCQGECASDTCDVTAYLGCEWDTGGGGSSPGAAC